MRSLISLGVVGALLIADAQANAPGPCVSTTVGLIPVRTFTCTIDDVTLSNFNFEGPPTFVQAQVLFGITPAGVVSVTLAKGPLSGPPFAGPVNLIGYTITAASGFQITGATLSSDVTSGRATVPEQDLPTITGNNSGKHFLSLLGGSSESASAVFSPGDTSDQSRVIASVSTTTPSVLSSIAMDWTVITKTGAAVPEPMSLSLFGLGLAGLALARRRRA